MKKKVKIIVLKTAGTNNDIETAEAFKLVGAEPEIIHINRFLRNEKDFQDYKILAIPGGFSYGDDISAGKVFANKLMHKLKTEIIKFANQGKLMLGICNGFQVLVKAGLLPFLDGKQSVTLTNNDSGKFECRWVHLKTVRRFASSQVTNSQIQHGLSSKNYTKCHCDDKIANLWTKNLPETIQLPVAHAEGKFFCNEDVIRKLEQQSLTVLKYVDENGNEAGYPHNPNGSVSNIAGIVNTDGNILGLMPHPERFISKYQHPQWTRKKSVEPYGLVIFKNAVEYAKKSL
ncbi:MAG: phosphoribosylformylglycinamidine synthase subunit PurQ [Elusimicrobiota bacterium]